MEESVESVLADYKSNARRSNNGVEGVRGPVRDLLGDAGEEVKRRGVMVHPCALRGIGAFMRWRLLGLSPPLL